MRARVEAGRLTLDEPTELPDGTEIEVFAFDGTDELDPEERERLHDALDLAWASMEAGRLVDAATVVDRVKRAT